MKYKIIDIGISNYSDCYALQKQILQLVKTAEASDHIIITEHNPVFTIGRSGSGENLLVKEDFLKAEGIQVIDVDRGGDITYHGPGQIVMYPIVKLIKKDLHAYLRFLEDIVINLLKEYNIDCFKVKAKTGVWTQRGKISSIGIGVSRWVAYHGVSLNLDCNLEPFSWIHPCGFKGIKVTSMQEHLKDGIDKAGVKKRLLELFSNGK